MHLFLPGAGAFEVTAHKELEKFKDTVKGKARLGIAAYAEALLVIPKVLATNSGFDAQVNRKILLEFPYCDITVLGHDRQASGGEQAVGGTDRPRSDFG